MVIREGIEVVTKSRVQKRDGKKLGLIGFGNCPGAFISQSSLSLSGSDNAAGLAHYPTPVPPHPLSLTYLPSTVNVVS